MGNLGGRKIFIFGGEAWAWLSGLALDFDLWNFHTNSSLTSSLSMLNLVANRLLGSGIDLVTETNGISKSDDVFHNSQARTLRTVSDLRAVLHS